MKRYAIQACGFLACMLYACSPEDGLTGAIDHAPRHIAQSSAETRALTGPVQVESHDDVSDWAIYDALVLAFEEAVADLEPADLQAIIIHEETRYRFISSVLQEHPEIAGRLKQLEEFLAGQLNMLGPANALKELHTRYLQCVPGAPPLRRSGKQRGTPCFDEYQKDMNQAAIEWTQCTLSSLGLNMPGCSVTYYAKVSVLRQQFENCVRYGIEN